MGRDDPEPVRERTGGDVWLAAVIEGEGAGDGIGDCTGEGEGDGDGDGEIEGDKFGSAFFKIV